MTSDELAEFAKRYAEAWCSQNPESVAAFFAENASLTVNGGPPTPALEIACGFMRDFPDMIVTFDKLEPCEDQTAFHWTLTGTHAGTGNHVRISGYELWKIDNNGLIAESKGHFDAAEYERQLKGREQSLVSTYIPPDRKESKGRSKTGTAKAKHDWRLDSATEKQNNYLASFGVTAPAGLTKGEASDLIERCLNDPEAVERQRELREIRYEEERRERASFPSFYLKADIATATREVEAIKERRNKAKTEISAKKKEVAAAQRNFKKATDDDERQEIQTQINNLKTDLEAAESELADLPVEMEDAQTELQDARQNRLSFWKATFRQDWVLMDEENRLGDFEDAINHLYAQYGRYFRVPTNKQVIDVLEVLDNDSPDWDRCGSHVFYTRLEAMSPDLARRSATRVRRSRSQGCLVLLVGIICVVVYYVIIR